MANSNFNETSISIDRAVKELQNDTFLSATFLVFLVVPYTGAIN